MPIDEKLEEKFYIIGRNTLGQKLVKMMCRMDKDLPEPYKILVEYFVSGLHMHDAMKKKDHLENKLRIYKAMPRIVCNL